MRNINSTNRGQSAIEFLVTYGWAILAAMITIGTLSYFGIFNAQRYVNDVCNFGDQMVCNDFMADTDGVVKFQLRNNFGVDIDISSTIIRSIYGETDCDLTALSLDNIPIGSLFEVQCDITDRSIPANDKLKYRAIVTFNKNDTTNMHNQTGDVMVTVQEI